MIILGALCLTMALLEVALVVLVLLGRASPSSYDLLFLREGRVEAAAAAAAATVRERKQKRRNRISI